MKMITQKQINHAFRPTLGQKAKIGLTVLLGSFALWTFYHGLSSNSALAMDNKSKAPATQILQQQQGEKRIPLVKATEADSAVVNFLRSKGQSLLFFYKIALEIPTEYVKTYQVEPDIFISKIDQMKLNRGTPCKIRDFWVLYKGGFVFFGSLGPLMGEKPPK
ncbi:MAG: hypothetical protein V1909_05645 [Candidatus Micrarchaeota archaeon]